MKYVFIINPRAGEADNADKLRAAIAQLPQSGDCEVYVTRAAGDATEYVRARCRESARRCASSPAAATAQSTRSSTARSGSAMSVSRATPAAAAMILSRRSAGRSGFWTLKSSSLRRRRIATC